MTDLQKLKIKFFTNPNINPRTGKKIKINNNTYKKLVDEFGTPNDDKFKQEINILKNNRIKLNVTSNQLTFDKLWEKIVNTDFSETENIIKHLLLKYGTKEPCNRFDVGNTIEYIIADFLKKLNFDIEELPNANRVDLCINKSIKLSIKYSSAGNITLHNSKFCINKDVKFTDVLLLTPNYIYLITSENLLNNNIEINDYLKNKGDSLQLKRNLLTFLRENNFNYYKKINLNVDKNKCENKLCSKLFYRIFMEEYRSSQL